MSGPPCVPLKTSTHAADAGGGVERTVGSEGLRGESGGSWRGLSHDLNPPASLTHICRRPISTLTSCTQRLGFSV